MAYNRLMRYERGYSSNVGNTGNVVTTLDQLAAIGSTAVTGVCCDYSGNIYLTDADQHIVIKIVRRSDSVLGQATVLAGLAGTSGNNGSTSVIGTAARFNSPHGICCDKSGNLYVADTGNNQIRKIEQSGRTSLVAGSAGAAAGLTNGVCLSARFRAPSDVAINNSGWLYVSDTGNNQIRVIRIGMVYLYAGSAIGTAGNAYGSCADARFRGPLALSVKANGDVLVSDTGNYLIKVITDNGYVSHFSGTGTKGSTTGIATVAQYSDLRYGKINRTGDLFVIDFTEAGDASRLVRVDTNGKSGNVVAFGAAEGIYVSGVGIDQTDNLYVAESVIVTEEWSSSSTEVASWSSSSSTEQFSWSSSSTEILSWSSSSNSSSSVSSNSSSSNSSSSNSSSYSVSSSSNSSSSNSSSNSSSSTAVLSWSSSSSSSSTEILSWSSSSSSSSTAVLSWSSSSSSSSTAVLSWSSSSSSSSTEILSWSSSSNSSSSTEIESWSSSSSSSTEIESWSSSSSSSNSSSSTSSNSSSSKSVSSVSSESSSSKSVSSESSLSSSSNSSSSTEELSWSSSSSSSTSSASSVSSSSTSSTSSASSESTSSVSSDH